MLFPLSNTFSPNLQRTFFLNQTYLLGWVISELVGLDGWMFDGGEILVSCLMVAKGITISTSTPSVFDTLLPVGFPIIFRERNTHTEREREFMKCHNKAE